MHGRLSLPRPHLHENIRGGLLLSATPPGHQPQLQPTSRPHAGNLDPWPCTPEACGAAQGLCSSRFPASAHDHWPQLQLVSTERAVFAQELCSSPSSRSPFDSPPHAPPTPEAAIGSTLTQPLHKPQCAPASAAAYPCRVPCSVGRVHWEPPAAADLASPSTAPGRSCAPPLVAHLCRAPLS